MRETFVLVLSDRRGSLLEAERPFARRGVRVVRASFNKVVDVHTLFLEVEGPQAAIEAAGAELAEMRLLPGQHDVGRVRLVEARVGTDPGAIEPVLEVVDRWGFNITYLDVCTEGVCGSCGDATDRQGDAPKTAEQVVRMGVYVPAGKDGAHMEGFVADLRRVSQAHMVSTRHDHFGTIVDNNAFYLTFAREMRERFALSAHDEDELLVNANRLVQNLERQQDPQPFKPFEFLRQFAGTVARFHGNAYAKATRVTRLTTATGARMLSVEPPCGSTTWVLERDDGDLMLVDCGYACYRDELLSMLRAHYPDFDRRGTTLVLTHGDVDHMGCCDAFDRTLVVDDLLEGIRRHATGGLDWREQNPVHLPYMRIGNIITRFVPPDLSRLRGIGAPLPDDARPIRRVLDDNGMPCTIDAAPFHLEVWQGAGGHVRGETILVDRANRIAVTGDVFVNVHGETKPQSRFNMLAPYLMTSVDTDPELARAERAALFAMLEPGDWQILGGHGGAYAYHRDAE